jgi:hypothetical protein
MTYHIGSASDQPTKPKLKEVEDNEDDDDEEDGDDDS